MPFCSKCGNPVQPNDRFCKGCGASQPIPAAPAGGSDPFANMDATVVSALCYIPFVGWIVSIYVLSVNRFQTDRDARFHAFQGLYIFVAWLVYDWVLEGILYGILHRPWFVARSVKLLFTLGWIWMVYQTSQKQLVRIPFISELADKSVNEQK